QLLEPEQLDKLTGTLQHRFPELNALLDELMERGWLTAYQVARLLAEKAEELVLDRYVILEQLGEGGMGQVLKARHRDLGRISAIKLIRKELLNNADVVRRFQREVRAAGQLSNPHIVLALEARQIGGTHVLVMEYIEGAMDLARLVKEKGPLPVAKACDFIR